MVKAAFRTENGRRQDLVEFGKWLYRLGFVPGTSGNLSVRLDRQYVLASPTGVSKYLLRPRDMVVTDLDGRQRGAQER